MMPGMCYVILDCGVYSVFFFFFQAEDGIRDRTVTGVQTCALPISQRVHAIAHFLRATQGSGAVISLLGRRAPELRHIRRWLQVLFSEPFAAESSTQLLAGWFATAGAGVLFIPPHPNEPYSYYEVGLDT